MSRVEQFRQAEAELLAENETKENENIRLKRDLVTIHTCIAMVTQMDCRYDRGR